MTSSGRRPASKGTPSFGFDDQFTHVIVESSKLGPLVNTDGIERPVYLHFEDLRVTPFEQLLGPS